MAASSDHTVPMESAKDGKEELNLPFGYHFCPEKHEVIHYLKNKILGRELPADIIPTIDLYRCNPYQIPLDEFKYGLEGEWYFFTTRPKGDLVVKDGYWRPILLIDIQHAGEVIGYKQVIVFYWGVSPKGTKSNWFIHEYRVNPDAFEAIELDDDIKDKIQNFVVCKVTVFDKSIESRVKKSSLQFSIESLDILLPSTDDDARTQM